MCGIVGLVNIEQRYSPADMRRLTLAMREVQIHRGPDDAGLWLSDDNMVCLGHRRLSIVDLRPEGRQPMLNEDGGVAVTFNGEIFNYPELRRQLADAGHRFATRTDTETLCHLFEHDPQDAVARLEGMYAFGIWRRDARELVLARDPFGKKPLYYAIGHGLLAFASELTSLEQIPGLCTDIDEAGLQQYLLVQYAHAPWTIYRGCRKIEPGCMCRFRFDGQKIVSARHFRHFQFEPGAPTPRGEVLRTPRVEPAGFGVPHPAAWQQSFTSEDQALETLRHLLTDAVRDRLMGDVPLGAFLSGGIDSSIVVATMVRELGVRPKTFSMGFTDAPTSEHLAARQIAAHLGTDHHEIVVSPSALDLLPLIAGVLDEPNGDSSCLPVYLLSELTRKHVTVALSGDGGDEMFGGYERYKETMTEAAHPWRGVSIPRRLWRWWKTGRLFFNEGHAYYSKLANLPVETVRAITGSLHPDVTELLGRWHADLNDRNQPLIHRMRRHDVEAYMPGSVLAKVDRMSMQYALEVRCPLLDVRLARWAARLPAAMLHDGTTSKKLLKKLASRYLPAEIIQRPKIGFGLPGQTWAQDNLLSLANDLLLGTGARLTSHVDRQGLKSYLQRQRDVRAFSVYQVWSLLILEQWLRGKAAIKRSALAA